MPKKEVPMRKGFTLVEIMIVVAIIALLAVLAIPSLLRTRMTANESAAQSTLNSISSATQTYRSSNPEYPDSLGLLENPASGPAYITFNIAAGVDTFDKQGYTFTYYPTTDAATGNTIEFGVDAIPLSANTGTRTFCITEDGVLRGDPNGGAIGNRAACLLLNPVDN
jgi:prepilin-type N-terminal cleavage/methylation domain-containing protein